MKKVLLFLIAALAFINFSCSDSNNNNSVPVDNLDMPESSTSEPIIVGATVTISGEGFEENDEIWFRPITRAVGDIKAEDIAVTSTGISFTAPAISGQAKVILKRVAKEYSLGNMYFTTDDIAQEDISLVSSITIVSYNEGDDDPWLNGSMTFEYDDQNRVSRINLDSENDESQWSEIMDITYGSGTITLNAVMTDEYDDDDDVRRANQLASKSFSMNKRSKLIKRSSILSRAISTRGSVVDEGTKEIVATLNDAGYVVEIVGEEIWDSGDGGLIESTYDYDNDNRLHTFDYEENFQCTWIGANLTNILEVGYSYDAEYSEYPNNDKINLDLNYLLSLMGDYFDIEQDGTLSLLGLFGERSENMVSKFQEQDEEFYSVISYELDNSGRIIKITSDFYEDEENGRNIYTISYK